MFVGSTSQGRKPEGYRQQSGAGVLALTNIPPAAQFAVIIPFTNAIRAREDGVDPTASVGMPFAVGTRIELTSRAQINKFRAIAQTASTELNISYYSASPKAYN